MKSILWHLLVVLAALAALVLLALGLDLILFRGLELGAVKIPKPPAVTTWALPQGWSPDLTRDYHTRTQGTKILPESWFRALQEPSVDPIFSGLKLASPNYLRRFGFSYDPDIEPDLPIGFAIDTWKEDVDYTVPPVRKPTKMVGLTCAACHTGRLELEVKGNKRHGFLVEGGSAMINLSRFQEAVGQALFWTLKYRLKAFIAEVQRLEGDGHPDGKTIEDDLRALIDAGLAGRNYGKEHKLYPVDAGFARTDALGLIGNRVFGPLNDENQSVTDAPVNFPHLWDTSWFDWVQYNASIRSPLARNVGEALGVGAAVRPSAKLDERYLHTVRIDNLAWIEDVLGGDEPFAPWPTEQGHNYDGGLQPPRWEDLRRKVAELGGLADRDEDAAMTINETLRARGRDLYMVHCSRCHLPPRDELRRAWYEKESEYWQTDERSGKKFLRLRVIDLDEIGTDPNQAVNFYRRFAVVPNPKHGRTGYERDAERPDPRTIGYPRSGTTETISAEEGLYRVTSILRAQYFEDNHLFQQGNEQARHGLDRGRTFPIDGKRPEILLDRQAAIIDRQAIEDVIRANLGYKARPLDGVWATPPYLHNGSVPSLDQMLMPAERRDRQFYLGTNRFDPIRVGYRTEEFPGSFLLDTTLSGNRNAGHEFRNFTLEEFESAMLDPKLDAKARAEEPLASRWDRVLGSRTEGLDDDRLWAAMREKTAEILKALRSGDRRGIANNHFLGVRGVLDPEFTPDERRALIEYLKSI